MPQCQSEFNALSSLVRHLGALSTVKAPTDLLEKLHARQLHRPRFISMLRAWFVPFKIKVPLNLAAATLTAILVVFLVNIQQQKVHGPAPQIAQAPVRIEQKAPLGPSHGTLEAIRERIQEVPESSEMRGITKSAESQANRFPMAPGARSAEPVAHRAAPTNDSPIAIALMIKDVPVDSADVLQAESAPAFSGTGGAPDNGAPSRLKSLRAGKGRPAAADISAKEVLRRISNVVETLGGNVHFIKYEKQTRRPLSIHIEIPGGEYQQFVGELNEIGTVHLPATGVLNTTLEDIAIVISMRYE